MSDASQDAEEALTDGTATLTELALNLRWSWNHASDELCEALDKTLWCRGPLDMPC